MTIFDSTKHLLLAATIVASAGCLVEDAASLNDDAVEQTQDITQPDDDLADFEYDALFGDADDSAATYADTILACRSRCDSNHMIIGCDERSAKPIAVNASTTRPWRNVGRLSSGCTGTLIGDRWVLTAAHCVRNAGNKPITFSLAQTTSCTHPNGRALVRRVHRPRNFEQNSSQTDRALDYALLELYGPIPGAQPMALDYVRWGTLRNKSAFSIGYPSTTITSGRMYQTGTSHFGTSPNRWLGSGEKGLLEIDTDAEGGQSGSPVYVFINGVRTVVGVLLGSPVSACLQGDNWASRMTTGAIEHIENAMDTSTLDFFWEWVTLPSSPMPPIC